MIEDLRKAVKKTEERWDSRAGIVRAGIVRPGTGRSG